MERDVDLAERQRQVLRLIAAPLPGVASPKVRPALCAIGALALALVLVSCDGSPTPTRVASTADPAREARLIDQAFVVDYCRAYRELYEYRTTNWKESVRAGVQLSPAADNEVIQAWRQYEAKLAAFVPPPDLRIWRDDALSSLQTLLSGSPSGLDLETKYHPGPFPDTARRLEPIAQGMNCSLPLVMATARD